MRVLRRAGTNPAAQGRHVDYRKFQILHLALLEQGEEFCERLQLAPAR